MVILSGFLGISNLAITVYLALEVAQLKRSLAEYDAIDVKPPAIIELVHSWKA